MGLTRFVALRPREIPTRTILLPFNHNVWRRQSPSFSASHPPRTINKNLTAHPKLSSRLHLRNFGKRGACKSRLSRDLEARKRACESTPCSSWPPVRAPVPTSTATTRTFRWRTRLKLRIIMATTWYDEPIPFDAAHVA